MSGFYFFKYTFLQVKRALYRFPIVFAGTVLLAGSLVLVVVAVADNLNSGEKQTMVEVGVTGDVSNEYVTMAIAALRSLDDSRFAVNLNIMEETEARAQLLRGEIGAYFIIPEGMIEAIMYGENFEVKYYTCKDQAGLGTLLVNEFSEVMYKLLTKSQNGVYGLQDLCIEYGTNDLLWTGTEELNIEYITFVLQRQKIFDVQVLGISNELSVTGYYICSFLLVFFMLFGLHGCALYINQDTALKKLLAVRGCSSGAQILSEFLAYSLLLIVSSLGILAVCGVVCDVNYVRTAEWNFVDFFTLWNFGIQLIPVMLMFTAMALFGHEVAGNMVSGLLLQFLMTIGMGYISGCFYPADFFPEAVQFVGKVLPSGVALEYAAGCMSEKLQWPEICGVWMYTFCFTALTYMLRKRKLSMDGTY